MISIVIPAYNEEKRILESLEKITNYLRKNNISSEIIVIDDGSTDNTFKVLIEYKKGRKDVFVLKNSKNKGKGYSVKKGMIFAHGEKVLFTDADLSTPIEELALLINSKSDIAIGSRALAKSRILKSQPFYRVFMGKTFNLLVQILCLPGIKDTQCGFKLFSRRAAKEIFSRTQLHRFGFDVESLYIARKKKFTIKEVPVRWSNAEGSKVRPIKDAIQMFLDLLIVRWNDVLGKYN